MLTAAFYSQNRQNLCKLSSQTLFVIAANSRMQSSADVYFPFRQDSNFLYVTGISEPDLLLLINSETGESTLLLPDQNDYQIEWDGENTNEEFGKKSGVKKFDRVSNLSTHLKRAQKQGLTIGYLKPLDEFVLPYGFYSNPARRRLESEINLITPDVIDVRAQFAELRTVKQPVEIEAIQTAIDITATSLADVKQSLDTLKTEADIVRMLLARFYDYGGDGHAFDPIVASAQNAATIHYMKNVAPIKRNCLLLLDVGASFNDYAADISRTWAVGSASQRQKDIFEAVRELQQEAYHALKPGVIIHEYQQKMDDKAKKAYQKLGIKLERFPHGFSHYLGLDVHDAGDYSQPIPENAVLTVEPGIYLPKEGIGVRIEDNVLITKTGIKILSEQIPLDL